VALGALIIKEISGKSDRGNSRTNKREPLFTVLYRNGKL
jgi:hypothetical protein